jgi:hypothetical protein
MFVKQAQKRGGDQIVGENNKSTNRQFQKDIETQTATTTNVQS